MHIQLPKCVPGNSAIIQLRGIGLYNPAGAYLMLLLFTHYQALYEIYFTVYH